MTKELKEFFEKNKKAAVAFVAMGIPFSTEEEAEKFCAGTSCKPEKVDRDGAALDSESRIQKLETENKDLKEELKKAQGEINNLINQIGGPDKAKKAPKVKEKKGSEKDEEKASPGDDLLIEEPAKGGPADTTGTGQVVEN